jgi:cation:H+ antiporter
MNPFEIILYLSGELVFLFLGAEGLIRGSANLAIKIGITPLVVGLTVVALGTSAPELVVSLKAALMGNGSISLGNVIGSNIANITLILGIGALVRPIKINAAVVKRDVPIMLLVSILLVLFLLDGQIGFFDGLIFIVGLILYTAANVVLSRKEKNIHVKKEFEKGLKSKIGVPLSLAIMIVGLTIVILGANLFVQGAVAIAKLYNVSDAIVGLTIVSIGTSLPELATSIVASYKNQSDLVLGNVIGSNIMNILAILGITSLIVPIYFVGISYVDIGVMLLSAIILLPLIKRGSIISRTEGVILLIGYIGYVYYLLPK